VNATSNGISCPRRLAAATAAELVGTYMLVLFGAGTVLAVWDLAAGGPLDAAAIGLAFGFTVLVVVYAFGHVSGAHINPSVTLGLTVAGKFPWRAAPAYLTAQFGGAVLAALTLWAAFGDAAREEMLLGATVPGAGAATVALVEFVITFLLLVVVMATATDDRASPPAVGMAIGLTIAVAVFAMLPVSGGSLNAARSLGPMLVAGEFPSWLVYAVAPAAGGIAGAAAYELMLRHGQPPTRAGAVEERPKAHG
jgi:MIP family channel proteins